MIIFSELNGQYAFMTKTIMLNIFKNLLHIIRKKLNIIPALNGHCTADNNPIENTCMNRLLKNSKY